MNVGDNISIGTVSGDGHRIGSRGNTYNIGTGLPHQDGSGADGARQQARGPDPGAPRQGLHAFADIVGYSQLNARLQKLSQADLRDLIDDGLAQAGVPSGQVAPQDQGDARLLWFPGEIDPGQVLAVMPRAINERLTARNEDMAPHARMRVRLSFTMGAAESGAIGLTGRAVVAAVRLGNSGVFRGAMHAAPDAQCGVIMDSYLYGEYVGQGFRADLRPDEYAQTLVFDPDKGFEAMAWLKLFGYSGQETAALLR